jgi:hypothetical protein
VRYGAKSLETRSSIRNKISQIRFFSTDDVMCGSEGAVIDTLLNWK